MSKAKRKSDIQRISSYPNFSQGKTKKNPLSNLTSKQARRVKQKSKGFIF